MDEFRPCSAALTGWTGWISAWVSGNGRTNMTAARGVTTVMSTACPSILFVDAAAVVEAGVHVGGNEVKAGVPVFHGQVSALDPDGDRLSYGFLDASGNVTSSITTEWGTISIDPAAGTFTYTLNNDSAESLAEGDTRRESFTVQVSDGRGGTATANVNVTITGTNDVPTLELTDERLSVGVDDMPDVTGNISRQGRGHGGRSRCRTSTSLQFRHG